MIRADTQDVVIPVLECVTFRLNTVDGGAFLEANQAITHWLRQQAGFVSRTLAEGEDGQWTDLVVWSGAVEAAAAAAAMNTIMADFSAMSMIDPSSIVMRHQVIRVAT